MDSEAGETGAVGPTLAHIRYMIPESTAIIIIASFSATDVRRGQVGSPQRDGPLVVLDKHFGHKYSIHYLERPGAKILPL